MKVIATKMGWYDNDRKRAGDIFEMLDKDYTWEQEADEKRGIKARTRVCQWVIPFDAYKKIREERLDAGWRPEEAADVETMVLPDPTVKPEERDDGPVASTLAAKKAAAKKTLKVAQ